MQELEQTIREQAYQLWVADGCREGNAESHWLTAQREVLASSLANFGRVKNSDAALTKPEKKSAHRDSARSKKKRRAA